MLNKPCTKFIFLKASQLSDLAQGVKLSFTAEAYVINGGDGGVSGHVERLDASGTVDMSTSTTFEAEHVPDGMFP